MSKVSQFSQRRFPKIKIGHDCIHWCNHRKGHHVDKKISCSCPFNDSYIEPLRERQHGNSYVVQVEQNEATRKCIERAYKKVEFTTSLQGWHVENFQLCSLDIACYAYIEFSEEWKHGECCGCLRLMIYETAK